MKLINPDEDHLYRSPGEGRVPGRPSKGGASFDKFSFSPSPLEVSILRRWNWRGRQTDAAFGSGLVIVIKKNKQTWNPKSLGSGTPGPQTRLSKNLEVLRTWKALYGFFLSLLAQTTSFQEYIWSSHLILLLVNKNNYHSSIYLPISSPISTEHLQGVRQCVGTGYTVVN